MSKDKDGNITLKLAKKTKITHDTYIYRYSFNDPDWTFGLPCGNHVIFTATFPTKEKPEGETVSRKYTPISEVQNTSFVDFVIKVYRSGVHPRFPDGGKMTQHLETLNPGSTMLMEGPKGKLTYHGLGQFTIRGKQVRKRRVGCVAGGTGITPVYQVIQGALRNEDGIPMSLVFGNRTVDDILLKEELEQLQEGYKEQFKLFFTVDVAPPAEAEWKQGVGFVTQEMLKEYMPAPSEDTLILFCGPPPFEAMMKKHMGEMGYTEDMWFKF